MQRESSIKPVRLRPALLPAFVLALGLAFPQTGIAEVKEVVVARQWGIAFLPLVEMEENHLIEKHAQALGIADQKVTWGFLSGSAGMNDALLSGNLSFAAGAPSSLLLLWEKTRNTANTIKGVSAINAMPVTLNTRNPRIKTIADFTERDKIGLPSVKLSVAAFVLEMAAAKAFGDANYARLDPLTVSVAHPDAVAALSSDTHEIDSHFASPPYEQVELKDPRIHTVLNSYDIIGDANLTVFWATQKFVDANPKTTQAVFDALADAIATINRDKRAAAELYLRVTKEKMTLDDLVEELDNPHIIYTNVPMGTGTFAAFMHRVGVLRTPPNSWQDVYFPLAHQLPGN
ncbi:MAG: ABC transporter substrate-binding protein [Alphaproteobacteria bacterium]|nr:ABC transporter substrate-binding protein [Alphaproteobacteria bacterium]